MTPQQKFQHLSSVITSGFNFGRFKTLGDYYVALGHSKGELEYAGIDFNRVIGRKEIFSLLSNLQLKLETQDEIPTEAKSNESKYTITPEQEEEYLLEIGATTKEVVEQNRRLREEARKSINPSLDSIRIADSCELILDNQVDSKLLAQLNNAKPLVKDVAENVYTPQSNHPKQKIKLWRAQDECAKAIVNDLVLKNYKSQLIRAPAGRGKTFVGGAVLRRLLDNGWLASQKAVAPFPIIYLTRSSIVEQTKRVLANHFGIDVINEVPVLNIEQLRSRFGGMLINWETTILNGVEDIRPVWKPHIHPILIIGDECHFAKNASSQQAQIIYGYNDIELVTYKDKPEKKRSIYSIWMSATPFTRVIEAKYFVVATQMPWKSVYSNSAPKPLTNEDFPEFAKQVAAPSDPSDYCTAAIDRLMNLVRPYVKEIKGLRPQFDAINKVELINFESSAEQATYDGALEEAEKRKRQVANDDSLSAGQKTMCTLAIFTILRRASEVIRARTIARRMHKDVTNGYASVAACCFKPTIAKIVKCLIEEYGVSRSNISIIWGGITAKEASKGGKSKKKKLTHSQKEEIMNKLLNVDENNMEEMEDLIGAAKDIAEANTKANIKLYEDFKSIIAPYQLGSQSQDKRQDEIDKFQKGESHYCLFTFKAGGVGLSLHHSDEWSEFKCRKKKDSDWVMEEDIPKVPIRPRKTILTPIYSAIELVQGLGRVPRLTSLSNTEQSMLYYANTIEEAVAANVSVKLKCLKKVVQMRESWEDMIMNRGQLNSAGHAKDSLLELQETNDEEDSITTLEINDDED